MKLAKDERVYTLKDISDMYNIPHSTLLWRCLRFNFRPTKHKGKCQYLLTSKEVETLVDYTSRRNDALPRIIYVTRTTEIYHSKLNFTTLERL